jgi:hypothetical protein
MWISTVDGGLQRYDGYGFKDYQLEVENPDWTFMYSSVGHQGAAVTHQRFMTDGVDIFMR